MFKIYAINDDDDDDDDDNDERAQTQSTQLAWRGETKIYRCIFIYLQWNSYTSTH